MYIGNNKIVRARIHMWHKSTACFKFAILYSKQRTKDNIIYAGDLSV